MNTPENLQTAPVAVPQERETIADCHRRTDRTASQTSIATSTAPSFRLAFSVKEAADMLGVSEKTIRRLISRRLLRASRALRHLLIPKKELERFLDETTSGSK